MFNINIKEKTGSIREMVKDEEHWGWNKIQERMKQLTRQKPTI